MSDDLISIGLVFPIVYEVCGYIETCDAVHTKSLPVNHFVDVVSVQCVAAPVALLNSV